MTSSRSATSQLVPTLKERSDDLLGPGMLLDDLESLRCGHDTGLGQPL